MMRRTMGLAFLAAVILGKSCGKFAEGRQAFRDVLALRDQITAEFHDQVADVSVDFGHDSMTVIFENSPLRTASREGRQQRADAVAAFVMAHYKRPLKAVAVQFGRASEAFVGRPTRQ